MSQNVEVFRSKLPFSSTADEKTMHIKYLLNDKKSTYPKNHENIFIKCTTKKGREKVEMVKCPEADGDDDKVICLPVESNFICEHCQFEFVSVLHFTIENVVFILSLLFEFHVQVNVNDNVFYRYKLLVCVCVRVRLF